MALPEFTRTYLQEHPDEAARVLAHAATPDAVAVLQELSETLSSRLLQQMPSSTAASYLQQLPAKHVPEVLRRMGHQAACGVLRHLPAQRQQEVLQQIPASTAMIYRLLLRYPDDSIGALVNVNIVTLEASTPIQQAIQRIRETPETDDDAIYVVDSDQSFIGRVPLRALMQAPANDSVLQHVRRNEPTLPAQMSLLAAASHPGWREYRIMPALEHIRLIGVVHFVTLHHALDAFRGVSHEASWQDAIGSLSGAYWQMMIYLMQTTVSALPMQPAVKKE
jgi:magnesium transporter